MAKTRRKGEGSIRKRADGSWEFRLKGKSYYFKTEKEAIKEGRKIAQKAETCDLSKDKVLFDALAKLWMEKKKKTVKPATWLVYEYALDKLVSYLGSKKVSTLKKNSFQDIFDMLAGEGYSKSYIEKVRVVAIGIMDIAEDEEIVPKNYAKACIIRNYTDEKMVKDSFTDEEYNILMEKLPDIPFGDVIYIMLNTGMRGQELCALEKDSLIEKNGTYYLHIKQAMSRINGKWIVSEGSVKVYAQISLQVLEK